MTKEQNADLPLIDEANKAAWKLSLFWRGDHPHPDNIDRRRPPKPESMAELLEGARAAFKAAEGMLMRARKNLLVAGEMAGKAADGGKIDLRPFMAAAVMGVIKADWRRAKAEVEHWAEYVRHFEKQAGEAQAPVFSGQSFTPPWEGQEVALDEVPF